MSKKLLLGWFLVIGILFLSCAECALADELKSIKLPEPQLAKGKLLMQALKERRSTRSFSQEKLPLDVLSNLLWAACGVNRPDGKRTAPSAFNAQEIDLYVALEEGLYLFDVKDHALEPILAKDIRKVTGIQDFTQKAPVNLI